MKISKFKIFRYQTAIDKIKSKYSQNYLLFNNSKEAKIYFDKYLYTKSTFSKELQDTLICYSGDYCEPTNKYLNNKHENETAKEYDSWRSPIINKCINNLYNYDNWIEVLDNVLAIRYINLGKNKFRTTSKTIISCSLNFSVMEEVFSRNSYFNSYPYQMGLSDTMLIVLIKKGTKILIYDQLDDPFAIKQSEIFLSNQTKFTILENYRIIDNKIKNIYVVTPE